MADLDETNPLDNALISTYPANERAHRAADGTILVSEHSKTTGRHKFGIGSVAARDAIGDWENGSLWLNTDATPDTLQIRVAAAWQDVAAVVKDATTLVNAILTTPTLADFSNAAHDHADAAGGGGLGTGVVDTAELAADAVTAAKIAAGAVDTSELAALAVTLAELEAAAVSQPKLSTATATAAGSISGGAVSLTFNAYMFFPMIHATNFSMRVGGHGTDGASADAPRLMLIDSLSLDPDYDVDHRYVVA